ncbi:hypothetical protein RJ641_032981 [Dillenia turbinata]|uniref:Uncharacterized protein n=1 Tax=Dillenia turbinata TaxID=194707 RepID=A0AAN8VUD2_9MAGN
MVETLGLEPSDALGKAETSGHGVICGPNKDTMKLLLTLEPVAGSEEAIIW